MTTESHQDEALLQKLIMVNQRLTAIASNNPSVQLSSDVMNSRQTPSDGTGSIDQRLYSMREFVEQMGSQMHEENKENMQLSLSADKRQSQNADDRVREQHVKEQELRALTQEMVSLRGSFNATRCMFPVNDNRPQQSVTMLETTSSNRKLSTTECVSSNKAVRDHGVGEKDAKNKIDAIARENERISADIEILKKKIQNRRDTKESNDECNEKVMNELKREKYNLHQIINENEEKVSTLRMDIAALKEENAKLEDQLKDRDVLNEKLLRNKKLYENAMRELVSAKREHHELGKTMKQKLLALNQCDGRIKSLIEEKEHLTKQFAESQMKCKQEMNELVMKHAAELKTARVALNAQQKEHDEVRRKHEFLRNRILTKRTICEKIKKRIFVQKDSFQKSLLQLVASHSQELESISTETDSIKKMLMMMDDFGGKYSGHSDSKDNARKANANIISDHNVHRPMQESSDGLNRHDATNVGIWEP